jgi:hypothetical protein
MFNSNFISPSGRHFKIAMGFLGTMLIVGTTSPVALAQAADKAATPPAAAGASADSEGFIEDAPNMALKDNFAKFRSSIQGQKFATPADKQMFDEFYTDYEFKSWTLKKNATKITVMRNQLKTTFRQAKSGPVYDRLNELTLDVLTKKLKNKKYYPFFRVNAMLAIGDLNAALGNNPTPLPQALPVLLETLDDAQQLDAVKIAALTGIRRHVLLGVKDPAIAKAALKFAKVEDADVGKAWMRSQAIEILGYLRSAGANNEVVLLLQSILTDKKATLKLRCTAAEALGQLDLTGAAGLQPDKLLGALTQLMKDGCDDELKNVKDKNETVSPRKMKTYLDAVTVGLGDATKGVLSIKGADAKKIDELKKFFTKELLSKLDNEESTPEDLEKAVDATLKKVS